MVYIAIDLKSFYASVECRERGLDPLSANLVVADASRTEKTICLAVSPALKAYGIPGRPRLFEVIQKVKSANAERRQKAPGHIFSGKSFLSSELEQNPSLEIAFLTAQPRMARYLEISTHIYEVYLKYVAPEDIHVYSIDEVFIDVTNYLKTYRTNARNLAIQIIRDVLKTTGITATAGIGSNLFLAKVAMDIVAKKMPADENGVRIAELDEMTFRKTLWNHRPLTDFWRIGRGYAEKLESNGMYTLGDVARCSEEDEELLYRLFGVNAELLIDHAWGWEPCTIADIKSYKPQSNSISTGQVLTCPYDYEKARLVVREMADAMSFDLVDRGLVTDQIVLDIGYDAENLTDGNRKTGYAGEVVKDRYGRRIPKHAHGTANLLKYTASARQITDAVLNLYGKIVNPNLLVRRIGIAACRVIEESKAAETAAEEVEQMDFFTDYRALDEQREKERKELEKERKQQKTVLEIRRKFGKNALLKGMNYEEGATARDRNGQIGGHKA